MHGRELYATNIRKQRREATIRESRSVRLRMDECMNEGNQDVLSKVCSDFSSIFITDVKHIRNTIGR
jgi:hypothetical protein